MRGSREDTFCSVEPRCVRHIVSRSGMWHESANVVVINAFILAAGNHATAAGESDRCKEIDQ